MYAFRRKATEHHRVNRADPRTSLHRDDAFDRHRHVDQHPVALANAARLESIGEAADPVEQLAIRHPRHRAVVGLENHRQLIAQPGRHMPVEAVVGNVQLTVGEPAVERRLRFVEHFGERLVPADVLARQSRPVAGVIAFGFLTQRLIRGHPGNRGLFDEILRRLVNAQRGGCRFNCGHGVLLCKIVPRAKHPGYFRKLILAALSATISGTSRETKQLLFERHANPAGTKRMYAKTAESPYPDFSLVGFLAVFDQDQHRVRFGMQKLHR
jgi:hypothetical protein